MKIIITIALIFTTMLLSAQEHNNDEHNSPEEHQEHHHHVAVFTGVTSKLDHDENTFTLGFDYVYFFPKHMHWGLSIFTEAIIGEHLEWLIGVPVIYRANKHVWLRGGFGVELVRDEEANLEVHSEMLVRVGGGYDFDIGRFVLSPSLDIDIVRKHASLVAGLNIEYGF